MFFAFLQPRVCSKHVLRLAAFFSSNNKEYTRMKARRNASGIRQ